MLSEEAHETLRQYFDDPHNPELIKKVEQLADTEAGTDRQDRTAEGTIAGTNPNHTPRKNP